MIIKQQNYSCNFTNSVYFTTSFSVWKSSCLVQLVSIALSSIYLDLILLLILMMIEVPYILLFHQFSSLDMHNYLKLTCCLWSWLYIFVISIAIDISISLYLILMWYICDIKKDYQLVFKSMINIEKHSKPVFSGVVITRYLREFRSPRRYFRFFFISGLHLVNHCCLRA